MTTDIPAELGLVGSTSAERLHTLADGLLSEHESWALLIGAGLSATIGYPDWEHLLRAAGERFNVECPKHISEDNFPFLAEECLNAAQSPNEFWGFIQETLCDEPDRSGLHDLALSLPFDVFLTTNLDCGIERSHSALVVPDPRIMVFPDLNPINARDRRLAYLHGKCSCDAPAGDRMEPDRVVLTRSSYDRAYGHHANALPVFLESVFRFDRVLFVGTSLADASIRTLLDAVRIADEFRAREGDTIQRERHFALVPTKDVNPSGADKAWRGTGFGVWPVYYFNPEGGAHEGFRATLEWLSKATTPMSVQKVGWNAIEEEGSL